MDKLITPDFGLMFWTIINFVLLVLVLAKFAWKPVVKALEERENRLRADREAAEAARISAQQIQKELEAKMTAMANMQQAAMHKAVLLGEEQKEDIISSARNEASLIVEKAKRDMQAEKNQIIQDIRREVVGLSMQATEKILAQQADENTHRRIVDEMFAEIEKGKNK